MPALPDMSSRCPAGRPFAVALGVVALICLAGQPGPASAQPGGGPGAAVLDDDPFADELNPFGPGDSKRPALPPAEPQPPSPPSRPGRPLPVPFPEATIPDDATARPTMPDRGSWEPSPAESLLFEADKLDQAGKLEESRAKLREAIEKDPKLPLAYLALGVVSRRLGDFEGSVDALSKGLLLDPQDSEMYLRRGIAWFHLGLYGIALEDFEEAAGIAYDDPRPELWRGLTLMELDRPLEAINAYASSIRRDRTFMLAYLNRGLAYLIAGQPSKAEFDFDQAIRHDPDDVRAWFNRGVALGRQGRFTEAIHSYEQALKRNPRHEPSRRNLAAIRGRAGR